MHPTPITQAVAAAIDADRIRPPRRRRVRPALLATAVAVCISPAAAEAGFVGLGASNDLFYSDTDRNRANDVTISEVAGEILVTDVAGSLETDGSCRKLSTIAVACPANVRSVQVGTFDGNDRVRYRVRHPGSVFTGEGADTVFAGRRDGAGQSLEPVLLQGGAGHDTVSYREADRSVSVDIADGKAFDGRVGDREDVRADFESIEGSPFGDVLFGSPNSDVISGGDGNDQIAGGGSADLFFSSTRDGADDYDGGAGADVIAYSGRQKPLAVVLDNVAGDGEAGESDNVRINVENIIGGEAGDVLDSRGASSSLTGNGGDDFLLGRDGADTLHGGPGFDHLDAHSGNDVIEARDNGRDNIDCGTGLDTINRDSSENRVNACEVDQVGKLRLASQVEGDVARVRLSWEHPRAWRNLRTIEVRVVDGGVAAGSVSIRPRSERITAGGAIELAGSRLTHGGKRAGARFAMKFGERLAGRILAIEVEATDTRGRRQIETGAGTIEVAS